MYHISHSLSISLSKFHFTLLWLIDFAVIPAVAGLSQVTFTTSQIKKEKIVFSGSIFHDGQLILYFLFFRTVPILFLVHR